MIYTDMTRLAIKIAFEAHGKQNDRSGIPYVLHPIHVAEQMKDETTTIVALLHDVVEDTDVTLEDLKNDGFSQEVLDAVDVLTHKDGMKYLDYVRRLATNPIAKKVKVEDIKHNTDLTRTINPNDKIFKKMPVYMEALEILKSVETGDSSSKPKKEDFKSM